MYPATTYWYPPAAYPHTWASPYGTQASYGYAPHLTATWCHSVLPSAELEDYWKHSSYWYPPLGLEDLLALLPGTPFRATAA